MIAVKVNDQISARKKNAWGSSGELWFGEGNIELPPTPTAYTRRCSTTQLLLTWGTQGTNLTASAE